MSENTKVTAKPTDKKKFPTEFIDLPSKGWFYPEGHPLASGQNLRYRDLAEHPFIGPVKGTDYAKLLQGVFDEAGFTKHNTITQSQNTLIRRELILSGVGFSCILQSGWTDDLNIGQLVVLDMAENMLSLEVRVGSLLDREISAASEQFLEYLNQLSIEGYFDG